MLFQETRDSLEKLGFPRGNLFDLPTPGKKFPDEAHFRLVKIFFNKIGRDLL